MTLPLPVEPALRTPTVQPASRLRMTGYAALHVLLFAPTVLAFVLCAVGGALSLVVLGLPILAIGMPLLRWTAQRHRVMAARCLGIEVPPGPRRIPQGEPLYGRLMLWARDPMTWRELAWALVAMTIGFTVSLAFLVLFVGIVTGLVWWYGTEPIMRGRARLDLMFLAYGRTERLEQRVAELTETRADVVDHAAAELRRIERDLHDGAQARLVALSISLGMAEEAFATDPERARTLVSEARTTTASALIDLRNVVRGIHPPVLADRGLAGAVQALALDLPLPVEVEASLPGRPPAPVESALYFAIAECLANIGKHSGATNAWALMRHRDGILQAIVGDDGAGGADPGAGTGMLGVMRRLAAFDGTMTVASPVGGPTIVTLEVPCALSSPKTAPSSGSD